MTNPNQEEKRRTLFDMQEHPDRYTDEQVEALLADPDVKDFFHDMAMTRMAQQQAAPDKVDVDKAWKAFASRHQQALSDAPHSVSPRFKIAASVVGVVFLSAIALAAIHTGLFRSSSAGCSHKSPVEQPAIVGDSTQADTSRAVATAQADSLNRKPVVFDNAELSTILQQMAAFYHAKVVFENEDARHIRVFFNWDKTKTLQQNLNILNAFERIQVTEESGTLKVE